MEDHDGPDPEETRPLSGSSRPPPPGGTEPVPHQIGNYRVLERIGEGGMGVVYLARQDSPIRRQVALKVVKLGMDTREVIARFEAERQALAMMSHPSIAQVFDAGSTEHGRPYFVMEYVAGIPITEYCDRHRLTTTASIGTGVPASTPCYLMTVIRTAGADPARAK